MALISSNIKLELCPIWLTKCQAKARHFLFYGESSSKGLHEPKARCRQEHVSEGWHFVFDVTGTRDHHR